MAHFLKHTSSPDSALVSIINAHRAAAFSLPSYCSPKVGKKALYIISPRSFWFSPELQVPSCQLCVGTLS